MLVVRDVVSGYGELEVLRGLSARFEEGVITTVIGANGAGKSTLLKTIFGMLQAKQGSIEFGGADITNWSSRKILQHGLALVPQGRCNFPAMTVQDNLRVSLDSRRGDDKQAHLDVVYGEFPVLFEKRRTLAGNLSGGEQQILEMAMVLLQKPRLMLVDEPSLGLSPAMLDQVFAKILEVKQKGITVVMVEQNAKQALAISDRGMVLEMGRQRMEGAARDLLDHAGIRQVYLGG
ncbi:MAG TPA: ABC transporter ATP-binding protein [Chloroflexota bacterium]|nr:ABC transporter ATP-binding protein [Chloroflexota bacterium]